MTNETKNSAYIGYGVYASHDGYQIWLAANHHENKVIVLEPDAMHLLIQYANKHLGFDYITKKSAKDVLEGEVGSSTLDSIDDL